MNTTYTPFAEATNLAIASSAAPERSATGPLLVFNLSTFAVNGTLGKNVYDILTGGGTANHANALAHPVPNGAKLLALYHLSDAAPGTRPTIRVFGELPNLNQPPSRSPRPFDFDASFNAVPAGMRRWVPLCNSAGVYAIPLGDTATDPLLTGTGEALSTPTTILVTGTERVLVTIGVVAAITATKGIVVGRFHY